MKETYITGANGFVGKRLTEQLPSFKAIPHQELDTFKVEPFDRFFFLSTYGNMAQHTETDATVKANVVDLINVLRQTQFPPEFKSFVFLSSSSVKREVQTMYSRTKNAAEQILLSYMERYDAPITIIRPFSITGVGEQREHLIPTLIRSCIDGEPMDFVPNAAHDFIDVDDVVSGILALSKHGVKGIFELGSGNNVTNEEVKEMVEKVTGKKANIRKVVNSMRPYDSSEWVSVNFKARSWGWKPQKDLKTSIKEMVKAYAK